MNRSRHSIDSMRRARRTRTSSSDGDHPFELLFDNEGTVVFGWASSTVLYTSFEGALSAWTGRAYAERLNDLVSQAQRFEFFCDSSRLRRYDLLARAAFIRVVLTHRAKFASMTMLTWPEGISRAAKVFVDTLGEPIDVLTDADSFDTKLRAWVVESVQPER